MELKLVTKNETVYMSSRTIAEVFGKEVKHVHEAIRTRYPEMVENSALSNQIVTNGWGVYEYLLDEYQAIGLVMGFTGEKARALQDEVVKTFVDYRNGRLQPKTEQVSIGQWIATTGSFILEQEKRLKLVETNLQIQEDSLSLSLEQQKEIEKEITTRRKQLRLDVKYNGIIKKHFKAAMGLGQQQVWKDCPRKKFTQALNFIRIWTP